MREFEGMENPITIVEVHFLDDKQIKRDFYGNEIYIGLVGFLRSEKKFDGFDALIAQINDDADQAKSRCRMLENGSNTFKSIQEYLSGRDKEKFIYKPL